MKGRKEELKKKVGHKVSDDLAGLEIALLLVSPTGCVLLVISIFALLY